MELGREAREAALAASKLGTDSTFILTIKFVLLQINHLNINLEQGAGD